MTPYWPRVLLMVRPTGAGADDDHVGIEVLRSAHGVSLLGWDRAAGLQTPARRGSVLFGLCRCRARAAPKGSRNQNRQIH